MKCGFMVACQFAGQLADGAPIIVGIFRHMQVTAIPAQIAPFYLALELEAEPYEAGLHPFELCFIDEDGRILFGAQLECEFVRRDDLGPAYCYFAQQVNIREPIQRPGPHRLDLMWKGQSLAELRLGITL